MPIKGLNRQFVYGLSRIYCRPEHELPFAVFLTQPALTSQAPGALLIARAVCQVIDMLMFKANAELTAVLGHHFQRHHMLTKYVSKNYDQGHINSTPASQSAFLTAFLKGQ